MNLNMADVQVDVEIKFRLELCFKILRQYGSLLDSYVLDFFTENHLQKLPNAWRYCIDQIPLDKFEYLLNVGIEVGQNFIIWPLSILCVRTLVRHLSLQREIDQSTDEYLINFTSNKVNLMEQSYCNTRGTSFIRHSKLQNFFFKHVKPKKRYEIFKMARLTADVARDLNVDCVVDVGSGLGHLSRILAYGFDICVCSIETQSQLTKQAIELDSELETIGRKYFDDSEVAKYKRPVHLNHTIKYDLTAKDFLKELKAALNVSDDRFTFGIVGLHPCGDLASVLLQLFVNCSQAKFINIVGCCYHKLSTSRDSDNYRGFPMAEFCHEKYSSISYEARSLACHAIETYRDRLKTQNFDHLKVHCYRATLEKIIDKNWPQYRKSALGNVKSGPELNFERYSSLALKKLKLTVPAEDLTSDETQKNLSNWQHVVKFYSLRLMLAPLVETVILLDRKMFLLEKGAWCRILAAFDPVISPRNQLLLSKKL